MLLQEIKCPNCSAPLNARMGITRCNYCGAEFLNEKSFGFLPSLSQKFNEGMYRECMSISSNRLQKDIEDLSASFYRGISRLFMIADDYLEFDKTVLNLLEGLTTPVGDEKQIHADLKRSWNHSGKYRKLFLTLVDQQIMNRQKYVHYRTDFEDKIIKYAEEIR